MIIIIKWLNGAILLNEHSQRLLWRINKNFLSVIIRSAPYLLFCICMMKLNNNSNASNKSEMSRDVRKPDFCICENKDADQLRGDREADQRLCFRYIDSTIPLLSKSEISSLEPSSVTAQPSLCRTWTETPKTGFLTTRLKYI